MEIRYLGHSSFLIQTKSVNIVCDPYGADLGLKFPSGVKADIVTISHDHYDHNNLKDISGNPYIIKEPGEFEIKGVNIFGVSSFHDNNEGKDHGMNTMFLIEVEGVTICHLGDLGQALSTNQINELDGVDVLLIPVGGTYTLNAKEAEEVILQIEPKIVIPMHYGVPGLKENLSPVADFLKEMGKENIEVQNKLTIKSSLDLSEETQIVVLERSSKF